MHVLIALAPALIFLVALWFMDSFRLVRPSSIALALLYGAGAALGCEALHGWLMPAAGLDAHHLLPVCRAGHRGDRQGGVRRAADRARARRLPRRCGRARLRGRHGLRHRRERDLPARLRRCAADAVGGARPGHRRAARRHHRDGGHRRQGHRRSSSAPAGADRSRASRSPC